MASKPSTKTELAKPKASSYEIMQMDPAEVRDILTANAGTVGISEMDFERVTIPAGGGTRWAVNTLDGEQAVDRIEGVIVAFKDIRLYWQESFGEGGGGSPPNCKSNDGLNGIGDPGGECAKCELNQFGSAERGNGKACGEYRLLFVLQHDSVLPMIVSLPPTSLQACRKFFMSMSAKRLRYSDAVLSLGLEQTKNSDGIKYSVVTLRLVERLDGEYREKVRNLSEVMKAVIGTVKVSGAGVAETQ